MVTIKDIANRLGIAPSTVSKGLNDANDISPELKNLCWILRLRWVMSQRE